MRHGRGVLYDVQGKVVFNGQWEDGEPTVEVERAAVETLPAAAATEAAEAHKAEEVKEPSSPATRGLPPPAPTSRGLPAAPATRSSPPAALPVMDDEKPLERQVLGGVMEQEHEAEHGEVSERRGAGWGRGGGVVVLTRAV